MDGEAYVCVTRSGVRLCERCASVVTCPFCSGLIISNVIDRIHSCQDAPWSFWNVPGALERCASLHRPGARASRSRAALRLITGARGGRARPCTAWVRERRARVPRCASSPGQGADVRVPAPPGCASVARACRAAPHHINNRDAACCVPVVISLAAGCGERVTYCRRSWCTRLRSPCSTHRWPRGTPSTPRRFP
jgi:hypothetical protein